MLKTCFSRGRSRKTLTFTHLPGGRGKKGERDSDTVIQKERFIEKHKVEERNRLKLKKWTSGKWN